MLCSATVRERTGDAAVRALCLQAVLPGPASCRTMLLQGPLAALHRVPVVQQTAGFAIGGRQVAAGLLHRQRRLGTMALPVEGLGLQTCYSRFQFTSAQIADYVPALTEVVYDLIEDLTAVTMEELMEDACMKKPEDTGLIWDRVGVAGFTSRGPTGASDPDILRFWPD